MYNPGDIIYLDGTGIFADGIKCQVLEVNPVTGTIIKMKAVIPDVRLGKMGFFQEGDDWVAMEWEVTLN